MDSEQRSRLIKQAAGHLGFDRCGIAKAVTIARSGFLAHWLDSGYGGEMAYLRRQQDSRRDVRAWLRWAKSIIVVAMNYNQRTPLPQEKSTEPATLIGERGRAAMYAWGEDYHVVLRDRLDQLVAEISLLLEERFQTHVCVDTSAIIERELAAAAGIGWIGKNTLVLHESIGSCFFLGEIITDLDLSPDDPVADRCGTCTRCLTVCPTKAFPRPHVMNASRCISYLTIEHRGTIPDDLASQMGDWVFGCDLCQSVCPFNRRAPVTGEARLKGSVDDATPLLDEILSWSRAAYRARVKGKAWHRAKIGMWQRNALIVRRNLRGGLLRPSLGHDRTAE